ncbi:hypothetical protein [Halovivax cerinus]|uniref:Uncharacterized protein n=1 Tax=Halovivax cerinus TaxID=1487865 RepID=A0ABD5NM10_9EURY|nr:hypothetical protein [Halovivax cerinus]
MSDENADRDRRERDRDESSGADRESLGYTERASGDWAGRTDGRDEKLIGTDPEVGEIDEPTTDSAQASREARWGLQQGLAIGLVSIVSGLLVAFGLMQATGLVDLPEPLADSAVAHWSVFVALGVLFVAVFAYSQRGT